MQIPPKADILCELEVLKVQDVGDQEKINNLETAEVKNFADKKLSMEEVFVRASDYFSRGKLESALKSYKSVIQEANFSNVRDEEEKKSRNDILKRAHLNIAVCLNKTEKYDETLTHIRILENICCIEDQPKALYVKGFALMKLGELSEAVPPLVQALKLKPLDQQIIKAIEELNSRKKTYDINRKAFGKNLGFN